MIAMPLISLLSFFLFSSFSRILEFLFHQIGYMSTTVYFFSFFRMHWAAHYTTYIMMWRDTILIDLVNNDYTSDFYLPGVMNVIL